MPIDIPTLFVVLVATNLSLSIAMGWVTQRGDRDGLASSSVAFALYAIAYLLFAFRDRVSDFLSIWCGNVLLVLASTFLIRAVGVFQGRRVPLRLLFAPVLVIGLVFMAYISDIRVRIVVSGLVFLFIDAVVLAYLFEARRRTVGRGQHMMAVGYLVNAVVMAGRVYVGLSGAEQIRSINDATLSQSLLFLSAFVSLILIAFGFVLMAKERADETTRRMAMKDKLTDCWNRFRIEEVAQQEMLRLLRYGTPVSLIMIDLDFFKAVNDQHGHGVGDLILKDFARTVQSCIRNTDVLGRWGGEEFVVLLPASSYFVSAAIAERIRAAVEASEHVGGIRVTASLGFSSCQSTDSWDDWLGRADQALYRAKAQGRNRVESEMPLLRDGPPSGPGVARLVWSRDYETGNGLIDFEHRQLFEQANRLLGAMTCGLSRPLIAEKTDEFIASMAKHMRTEEDFLARIGYPQREEHLIQHRHLLDRAHDLSRRYASGELGVGDLLHFVIYEFSAQHLLIEDGKYAPTALAALRGGL